MSIKVGKQYKDAFKSICNLYKNGAIGNELIDSIEGNIIKLKNNKEFEYVETDAPNRGKNFGMTAKGASWFAGFRDETIDDSDSSWKSLLESVAENYHKKYSFVEFKENFIQVSAEEDKDNREKILKFIKFFFRDFSSANPLDIVKESNKNIDDIYCTSLKMAMDNGSGEAKIILGKLFFKQNKKTLVPLLVEESIEIQNYIDGILTENDEEPSKVDSNLIDAVVGAVENVIKNEKFDDYFTLSSLEDEVNVNNMVEKGPNDEVELNCRSAKVLGISHIRWNTNQYYFCYEGKPLLKFEVGINKKLTVYCINCGYELLVTGNQLLMKNRKDKLAFDPDLSDFGLTENEISLFENESLLSEHIFVMECNKNLTKRTECSRICCSSQVVEIDGEHICKKCPYPEILFIDDEGKYHLTSNLIFTRDNLKMTPRDNVKFCFNCRRVFTLEEMNDSSFCRFCKKTISFNDTSSTEKEIKLLRTTYRKYKSMLPIRIRLLSLFSKKYCFEDIDILVFLIGKKKYIFNKLEITQKGFIKGPKKIG